MNYHSLLQIHKLTNCSWRKYKRTSISPQDLFLGRCFYYISTICLKILVSENFSVMIIYLQSKKLKMLTRPIILRL